MDAMLTLVAPPGQAMDVTVIERASNALPGAAAPDRFAEGRAADIAFAGDAFDDGIADAVRAALADMPVDYAIQPAAGRTKRLLIADMDSTVVTAETLDEMAAEAGVGAAVAAITKRAMNGELDFEGALRERMAMLAGQPKSLLETVYGRIAFNPGAAALIAGMRKAGADCQLVSGGFKYFTARVAERLGFHGEQANDIEIVDGAITGRMIDPILDANAKVDALQRHTARLGVGFQAAATVGDGSNDIPMLRAAGLGVAWRGKPAVKAATRGRIDHGDLSTMLLFQRLDPA